MKRMTLCVMLGLLSVGCASTDEHRVDMSNVSRGVTVKDKTVNGAPLPSGGGLKLLKMVPPDYPVELRRAKVTGVVTVRHTVQADGSVTNVSVEKTADERLSKHAIIAVSSWRYEPYTPPNGKPLSFSVPITFDTN